MALGDIKNWLFGLPLSGVNNSTGNQRWWLWGTPAVTLGDDSITSDTISGVSRIRANVAQTLSGVSRIQVTTTQTTTGVSRIQVTTSQTNTGVSRIQATTAQTISGIGRLQVTNAETIGGVSRIQVTTNQTISGVSLISIPSTQNITGVSAIQNTTVQTISGVSRIRILTPLGDDKNWLLGLPIKGLDNNGGQRWWLNGTPAESLFESNATIQSITGVSAIQNTTAKTISGVSAIQNTTTRLLTGVSKIITSVPVTASDTLTLAITDASSVDALTGGPGTNDTLTLSITESSSVATYTNILVSASDMLTIGIMDGSGGEPLRSGERTDELHLGITELSDVVISTSGGGDATLTLPPNIMIASPRTHTTIDARTAKTSKAGVDGMWILLTSAGWSQSGLITATGEFPYMLFTPVRGFHSTAPAATIDTTEFWWYDSTGDHRDLTKLVNWVDVGITESDSAGNLAAEITAHSAFIATATIGLSGGAFGPGMKFESKIGGNIGNGVILTNRSGGTGDVTKFGGYIMQSKNSTPDGMHAQSVIQLRIQLGDNGSVMFGCNADGTELGENLGLLFGATADSRYTCGYHLGKFVHYAFADPYQVLVTPLGDSDISTISFPEFYSNSSFFFSSPYISPSASLTYCAFAVFGYSNFRTTLSNNYAVSVLIDGENYYQTADSKGTYGWAMLMYNHLSESGLKLWTSDPTCYQDAIVMLSKGQADAEAVGYIWNAYMTTASQTEAPRGTTGLIKYKGTLYKNFVMANNASHGTPVVIGTLFLLI